jgi:hypothetical protein
LFFHFLFKNLIHFRRGFQPRANQSEPLRTIRDQNQRRAVYWSERSWFPDDAKARLGKHRPACGLSRFFLDQRHAMCSRGRSFGGKQTVPSTTLLESEITSDLHVAKYGSFVSVLKKKNSHNTRRHHPS